MGRATVRQIEEPRVDEHWVVVSDFRNYEVSNYGRVCNISTGYDLTATRDPNGYLRVALHNNGRRREVGVHRLVARAFFLDFTESVRVEHKNGNKEDNTVLNLTLKPNETLPVPVRIKETGEEFASITAAARHIKGQASHISECLNPKKERTQHRGYTFEVVKQVSK